MRNFLERSGAHDRWRKMTIGILRLNCGEFGRIGAYNVQEVGICRQLEKSGKYKGYVFYLNRDVAGPTADEDYPNAIYLPHRHVGVHGILDMALLDPYKLDALIIFGDNQLWQNHAINWCRRKRIPCVCYWGGVLSQKTKLVNRLFTEAILVKNRRAYSRCVNVAKTNDARRQMLSRGLQVDRVINVGLDEALLKTEVPHRQAVRAQLGIEPGAKVLLFVGRLEANKRPLDAVKLLEALRQDVPEAMLILIGKGTQGEAVRMAIEASPAKERIRHVPHVEYRDMWAYYAASDCMVNLCDVEIFGMALLESMFYRCPVVARKIGRAHV